MAFEVTYRAKDFFFDRQPVTKMMADHERKALSRIGAFIRRGARSSIRRRKRASQVGQPPSAHSTDSVATIKNILFAYDPAKKSVVVGPVLLNQRNRQNGGTSSISVPRLLEVGGSVAIVEKSTDGGRTWRRADLRRARRPWEKFRTRRANYMPRPFMGPALEREQPKIPGIFASRAA